jgi:hypothetical protein
VLDFILSKMNLLILAVALFGIVSYFSLGLMETTSSFDATLLLNRLVKTGQSMANSPSYCDSKAVSLPRSLSVGGNDFFYVIKISKATIESNTQLAFSFIPRRDYVRAKNSSPPDFSGVYAVAADSFLTTATVHLYDYEDYIDSGYSGNPDYIFVDPQAAVGENADSIEFLKEVYNGETFLHIVPCNTSTCAVSVAAAGEKFYTDQLDQSRADTGFGCATTVIQQVSN